MPLSECVHRFTTSEVGFVFLDFHHQMMEVYELGAHGQTAEGRLGEDLMETMIVLDELGQRSLRRQRLVSTFMRHQIGFIWRDCT